MGVNKLTDTLMKTMALKANINNKNSNLSMHIINIIHHEKCGLYGIYALVGLNQKSHSFAAPTRSISDTSLASSRRSVSWGVTRKKAREKIKKKRSKGSERTPVGKINKRSFRYTRIRYTL